MRAYAKIYLDYRAKQDGLHNVKIRVTYGTLRIHYGTDFDLTSAEFDKIFYRKKKTTTQLTKDQQNIKTTLEALQNKATNIIDKLDPFTYPDFEKHFLSSNDMFGSVKSAFDTYINNLDAEQTGTADNYRASITSLESYKKNLKFTDITVKFLKNYERWMLSNGRSKTTVGMYLRALRAVFNQQDIDSKLYPFSRKANDKKYKIPKGRNIKKALTLDDISKIYNYQAESDQEDKARDYWMFLYLCNGMNVKDLCSLKWNNIKGDTIQFEREKTKRTNEKPKTIVVSLKAETWDIINKWGVKSLVADSYIFPHYDNKMTPERKLQISQQLIKNINKYMKRIALKVGINKDVTTYFARHSFATILKRSGANVSMISDLLGHSDVSVTANYLDGFEDDQIKRQTDVLLSFDKVAQ